MKRIIALALSFFIAVGMVPVTATAQTATSYNKDDVNWLGNSADYPLTINNLFDNGLRLVRIEYSRNNDKFGLVDVKGNFIVQPIYDRIQPQYKVNDGEGVVQNDDFTLTPMAAEFLFVDGYVQAIRDGKMGLLDTNGKEVVPCKYDAVGLPVEGMCRVILNGKLGYWDLKSKKEAVEPKYILETEEDKTAAGAARSTIPLTDAQALVNPATTYSANGKQSRLPAWFDFKDGYALVPMSTADKNGLVKAQIINKEGKTILSGGPYTYHAYYKAYGTSFEQFNQQSGYTQFDFSNGYPWFEKNVNSYPQFGPYMDYQTITNIPMLILPDMHSKYLDSVNKYVSGIVGPKGVMVKPQYHGAVGRNEDDFDLWSPTTANLKVYPEMSVFATNCAANKMREGNSDGYLFGTFDLSTGKKILPTRGHYDPKHHLIWGNADFKNNTATPEDGFIMYANRKIVKFPNTVLYNIDTNTGCEKGYLAMFNSKGSFGFVNVTTGKQYTHNNLKADNIHSFAAISDAGTILIRKGGKWGVVRVDDGKLLAPFQYELQDPDSQTNDANETWTRSKNAYAIVRKGGKSGLIDVNGKEILPCKYKAIQSGKKYIVVMDENGVGYYDIASQKFAIPIKEGVPQEESEFAVLGATFDSDGRLLKKDGTFVDAKSYRSMKGLFITGERRDSELRNGYDYTAVGAEGKFVMPDPEDDGGISSYTIVVEEGKIGYINCIFLDWVGKSQSSEIQKQLANLKEKKEAEKTKVLTTYNVVQKPTKLTYKYGEQFIIDGLVVESVDANGTRVKIENSRIMLMFVVGDHWTKIWSAQWGGTGINYTIPLKNGTNALKLFVDEEDTGVTINMELVN